MALGRLTYRFPVWRNIDRRASVLYLGSLYAGLFAEAGKAWTTDELDLNGNQKDVGFDLRLKGFTFYSYPVAASFEAAYSLNKVTYAVPFTTEEITYEKDWKFYGSVLFSF
jgi:outer membrane protein assembly factor BamA